MNNNVSQDKKDCIIPYTEPTLTNEVVYESDAITLRKIWEWDIVGAYEDKETGILNSLIVGPCFGAGISTYILPTGKRLSYQNYTNTRYFHNGWALVRGENGKYGLMDRKFNIRIPMEYDYPNNLCTDKGFVVLKKGNTPFLFNKDGEEIRINIDYSNYTISDIKNYYGICFVDVKDKNGMLHMLTVDEQGNIISERYQYGGDEDEDVCTDELIFVFQCKDNMLKRGAINSNLEEVIPCEFYELGEFWDREDFLRARIKDKWGVIDNKGNWVVEPMFGGIGYELENNMITFTEEDSWFEGPVGVYDIKQKKILFEPQFKYVDFLSKDRLEVEIFDESIRKNLCKIITTDGTVLYQHSQLSNVWERDEYIKLSYHDNGIYYTAILDNELNEIISADHRIDINNVYFNQKCFTFKKDNKKGLMSFDLNIMIEAKYEKLDAFSFYDIVNNILCAEIDNKQGIVTTDGNIVLPFKYEYIHLCKDNRILCKVENGPVEMFQIENILGK